MRTFGLCLLQDKSVTVIVIVLLMIAQVQSEVESSAIPVIIRRRPSADIYTILLFQQNRIEDRLCPTDNATYLVKERQCINNQNLFDGNLTLHIPTN